LRWLKTWRGYQLQLWGIQSPAYALTAIPASFAARYGITFQAYSMQQKIKMPGYIDTSGKQLLQKLSASTTV